MSTVPISSTAYTLSDPLATRPLRGDWNGSREEALALSRAEQQIPRSPIHVQWFMGGSEPSLVVWTGMASPIVVHENVLEILIREKLTGWRVYPVHVFAKSGQEVPNYSGLAIFGRCEPRDLSRSTIMLKQYPGGWIPHFKGHFFDDDSWDGHDFFMEAPDETGHVTAHRFATERAVKVLARHRVRNLRFERLTDVTVSTSDYEIVMPYRLPADFQHRLQTIYDAEGVPMPDHIRERGAS